MSAFAPQWLDLREPADRRARDAGVLAALARHFGNRAQITVTDLGCGTGATMRALGPHLPVRQRWRLVDHDAGLLDAIAPRCHGQLPTTREIAWQPHQANLQDDLEAILSLPAELVTMSALLDLTSTAWLDRLADAAAAHERPLYAALTYNGRISFDPVDPFDAQVLRAFNAHQRRDKGFGPAIGPLAPSAVKERLTARGFTILDADADWVLDRHDGVLQAELVQGCHGAACEQDVLERRELDRWLVRRLDLARAGQSHATVGHCDIWAYPPTLDPRSRSNSTS